MGLPRPHQCRRQPHQRADASRDASFTNVCASTRIDVSVHTSAIGTYACAYADTVARAYDSTDASTDAGTDASTIVDASANACAYAGTVA